MIFHTFYKGILEFLFCCQKFKVLSKCCQHDMGNPENPCKIKDFGVLCIIPIRCRYL